MKMKENRTLLVLILLSIVTFGIYPLFFWHGYSRDMNAVCEGDGRNTRGILARIVFSLLTFGIYDLVWMYGAGERISINSQRRNLPNNTTGGNVLLWYILGSLIIVGPFIALHKLICGLDQICADYNRNGNHDGKNYVGGGNVTNIYVNNDDNW